MLLIFGDADGIRLEHVAEMFRLKGGGVHGDLGPRLALRRHAPLRTAAPGQELSYHLDQLLGGRSTRSRACARLASDDYESMPCPALRCAVAFCPVFPCNGKPGRTEAYPAQIVTMTLPPATTGSRSTSSRPLPAHLAASLSNRSAAPLRHHLTAEGKEAQGNGAAGTCGADPRRFNPQILWWNQEKLDWLG